jgi:electron transport complex protein RnfB
VRPNAPDLDDLTRRIDAWLPQTQCTRCDYPRCLDYARAIATGVASINRCPPGGDVTLDALARITGQPGETLDPTIEPGTGRLLARVVEPECIGCALCLDACPVDAIVGAPKLMHTVIAARCTGCALCAPVCPMDCITLDPHPRPPAAGRWPDLGDTEVQQFRILADRHFRRPPRRRRAGPSASGGALSRDTRQAEIRAAVDRVRRRREDRARGSDAGVADSRDPAQGDPHCY